jgi:predicted unusual protein kinase regulating ubiquinone biosynthesis (AarF/ABC1/UbiB family)
MIRPSQPTGTLARGSAAGAALARAGTTLLVNRVLASLSNPSSPPHGNRAAGLAATRELYRAAAQLRGTALKIAQIVHWEEGLVLGPASDDLYQACYEAPPMSSTLVVGLFERELGLPPWKVFSHFELNPFAAASLGQVHGARLGARELCVKVRYPGIAASVDADLRALRTIARILPQRGLLLRILQEVQSRLNEECDYHLERERTQSFHDNLLIDGVEIPDTLAELCTDSLLTQRRLEGMHLRAWIATRPPQQARDSCAQKLDRVFTRSLYELNLVHADPNPGNYLFRDDGSVGLIDFGCVKQVSPEFARSVSAIIRANVAGDEERAFELALEFGFFGTLGREESRAVDRALLRPFVRWLVMPLRVERFDFGANAGFAAECGSRFINVVKHHQGSALYQDLLFVNRTLYGLYRTFEALGARVNLRNTWVSD